VSIKNHKKYALLAWTVCALGAVYYSYEYFLRISPSVMERELRSHFNLSATGFGLLSAFYYYAYVPMQLPVGVLMDRFGPKRLLTFACVICVIGTFMFANTFNFSLAAAGRFLVGLGSAFAFVGVLKLATIWLPEDKLGMVAGIATALGTIGAMLGDNLLGSMVDVMGWQETINFTGFFGIFLVFVLWFSLRDHTRDLKEGGTIGSFKRNMIDLGIIVRSKQVWIVGAYGCLVYLPTTVFAELWGIPYLSHAHSLSNSSASFCNSMLFLGFTIGAPSMGFISDKLKRRKLPMVVGATGAGIVMMAILYLPGLNYFSLSVLLFILGLLYSVQSLVFVVGREVSPSEAAGTAIAMTNMLVMMGAMFLQPLIGRLLDFSLMHREKVISVLSGDNLHQLYNANDYKFALSIIPIGIFIAVFLTLFLKETHAQAGINVRK